MWGNDYSCSTADYSRGVKVNFILEKDSSCKRILDVLHQDFNDIDLPEVIKMSKDDRKALEIFEESVEKKDDHYTIALPWKDKNTSLPNNKKMAEKRLLGLKRKLIANEDMYEKYRSKIKEYIDYGYVELITNEESNSRKTWYIPHHYVNSSNKFRIVFDCSAKFDGVSLNDKLLQGPDLSNNLLGVFLRFREEPIAVVGDIRSMSIRCSFLKRIEMHSGFCGITMVISRSLC